MNTVLRRGETVVRESGPWSPTIHRLLRHMRAKGVPWLPEPLGFDREGKEILSFVPGEVPHDTPDWLWSETLLAEIARALRQLHDASADFETDDARWQLEARTPREVICHNDFAPYNTTFIDGHFAGLIDFDTCAPGPRLWDIAYSAYRFVPLMPPHGEIDAFPGSEHAPFSRDKQLVRLRRFLAVYAGDCAAWCYPIEAVLEQAASRLEVLARFSDAAAIRSLREELSAHAHMYRAHAACLRRMAAQAV